MAYGWRVRALRPGWVGADPQSCDSTVNTALLNNRCSGVSRECREVQKRGKRGRRPGWVGANTFVTSCFIL